VTRLAAPPRRIGKGLTLAGAWRLDSADRRFQGYSGLVPLRDGRLAAFSDLGATLLFDPPGSRHPRPPQMARLASTVTTTSKRERDCEAVTIDPASGMIWVAFERTNSIVRLGLDLRITGRVRAARMHHWPANSGPEAMVRLADGRFIVLAENRDKTGRQRALLFAGDPVAGARPVAFSYRAPEGFRPTDMAQLPDGRVLVLNRRFSLPFRFTAALTLADPREIAPGRPWRSREIARLVPPLPVDNYEGLAIRPGPDGTATLWLISDDNQAQWLQHTLLLALRWDPTAFPPRAG
jgi:hypothetical protein